MNKNKVSEQELFEERLKVQLCEHRKKLGLPQWRVAKQIGNAEKTYQRWESTGKCLTDIFSLLKAFQVLEFSTVEIIDVLGLPPLTLNDMKAVCQDGETLKHIKEDGIYSYMRKNCNSMDYATIEKLLDVLSSERLKQRGYTYGD